MPESVRIVPMLGGQLHCASSAIDQRQVLLADAAFGAPATLPDLR